MVFSADTLKDTIEAQWSLGGTLSKTPLDNMKEIVQFFAYPQIAGNEVFKAVTVQKINENENEQVTEHPTFNEVSDIYEIEARYRTYDVQAVSRDDAYSDMESMTTEIVRILKTVFNPSTTTGIYFTATRTWQRLDEYNTAQPDLIRRLRFTLTTITSEDPTVFSGFGGVLIYDRDQGNADSKPGSDYEYTEVSNIVNAGGFKILKKGVHNINGISKRMTGLYEGRYEFETKAKQADIGIVNNNLLNQIGLLQNSGELAEVFLVETVQNENGASLNQSTKMQIIDFSQTYGVKDLVKFKLIGDVIEPPVLTVT